MTTSLINYKEATFVKIEITGKKSKNIYGFCRKYDIITSI